MLALAGAAGALARYGVGNAVDVRSFPWATLGINVIGSFLLGVLLQGAGGRLDDDVRMALGVGFLGAFTTFSTFGYETVVMLRDGRTAAAGMYVAASIVLGVGAAALGYGIGEAW